MTLGPLDVGSPPGVAMLVFAGVIAGFVNTLAGGGSLVTLPALMLLGLPPEIANATNRVAVLAQNLVSARAFDESGRLDRARAASIVAPTLAGSLVGAVTACYLPPWRLKPLLVGSWLVVATTLVRSPKASGEVGGVEQAPRNVGVREALLLFAIGVYGGFVQAGVGIFLLALLVPVLRYDLVRANALKVVAVGAFTAVALGVFVLRGQVDWSTGGLLALGNVAGAWVGVRYVLTSSERALRRVVFVAVVAICLGALFK
jgi:uncharacterized membrane protein YfcA